MTAHRGRPAYVTAREQRTRRELKRLSIERNIMSAQLVGHRRRTLQRMRDALALLSSPGGEP